MARVTGFSGNGRISAVQCGDESFAADFAVVGIGIVPNVELAQAAGLECDDGILVDERCRTSDPAIYAAGDCTNHPNPLLGRRLRLESVPNAMEQARVAAANLCGKDREYASVPWFWSDQYELKLQMVGFSGRWRHRSGARRDGCQSIRRVLSEGRCNCRRRWRSTAPRSSCSAGAWWANRPIQQCWPTQAPI